MSKLNLYVFNKLLFGSQRLRRSPSCWVSTLEISSKLSSSPRSRSALSMSSRDVTRSRSSTQYLLWPNLCTIVCSHGSSSVSTRHLTPRTRDSATLVSWILLVSRSLTWVYRTHEKPHSITFRIKLLFVLLPSLFHNEIDAYVGFDIL